MIVKANCKLFAQIDNLYMKKTDIKREKMENN